MRPFPSRGPAGSGGGPITAADITDSTSVGRSVLTATDAAAARTAIEAAASLPTATAAGQPLVSTGAGTTYAASDPIALPVAAAADWRLYAAATGDTSIPNAANPGTYDLTADSNAAAKLGAGSMRGTCFAVLDHQVAIADRAGIKGGAALGPSAWTVAVWCTLMGAPVTFGRYLLLKRNGDTDWSSGHFADLALTVGTDRVLGVEMSSTSALTSGWELPLGVPSLVVATYGSGTLKLYLNGTLIGTATPGAISWGSGTWQIGGQATGGGSTSWAQGLPGLIERAAVWSSALTAAQVLSLAKLLWMPLP